jgi:2,4-didehydro-3-deoxy-L-rhamnonate hydrolase
MKFFRYIHNSNLKIGIVHHETMYEISSFANDIDFEFFESGNFERLLDDIGSMKFPIIHPQDIDKYLAPIARPSKIVCVGLNYNDHAKEIGAETPTEPVIFLKSTSAYSGPFDDIVLPRGSVKTDWEVELAFVIGKKAKYVSEEAALDYIAGYTLMNDITERSYQLERKGTWDKGKGCDTFAPIGPYLVTKDEVPNPDNLDLYLQVNGEYMQKSNTDNLIFTVPFMLSYISNFMTLYPGDLVSTGTPCGIGHGMNPPRYLKAGDEISLGIEGIGVARQMVVEGVW